MPNSLSGNNKETTVNINDAFPSKYLKASDLKGQEVTVTIDRVVKEQVGRDREMLPIVYFAGKEKGVVLNKTNANKIAQIVGVQETDDWIGTQIKLYPTETEFGGETVECIRIKAATRPARQAPPPPPVTDKAPEDLDEDDIPF